MQIPFDCFPQRFSVSIHFVYCQTLTLARVAVVTVVMFEAKVSQIVRGVIGGIIVEVGNLARLFRQIP